MTDASQVDPTAQTNSDYFKIARAVDGDDWWIIRLDTALEIHGISPSRNCYLQISKAVASKINCAVDGTIDTSAVLDSEIDAAIENLNIPI